MKFIYHGNLQSLKDAISANAAQLQRNITIRENVPDMLLIGFDLWGYDAGGKYFVSHIHEENGYVTLDGEIQEMSAYPPRSKIHGFVNGLGGYATIYCFLALILSAIWLCIFRFNHIWIPLVLAASLMLAGRFLHRNQDKDSIQQFKNFMSTFTQAKD